MRSINVLGKIFISYSWADKTFVRRLGNKLTKKGYSIWLDEKELVPSDKLSTKIADAIQDSRIIIVVITENSLHSYWLAYELDLATKRMVEEDIRVIPLLKGDVEIPNQVKGLIYADFRRNSRIGYEALFKAIENEIPVAAGKSSFWSQIEYLLASLFDGKKSSLISKSSEYRCYDAVCINGLKGPDDDLTIPYAIIPKYNWFDFGLNRGFLREEYIVDHEKIPEQYFLLIFEKSLKNDSDQINNRINVCELDSPWVGFGQYEISVDLSGLEKLDEREKILKETKNFIVKHAMEFSEVG